MKNIGVIIGLGILIMTNPVYGQEHEAAENEHGAKHEEFKRHSILLEFGYTHIPDGFEEVEGDQVVWVPTIGLSYVYHFNHKWGVGLITNLETARYQIVVDGEDITRENVFIITAVATYEILPNWGVFAGPGIEIEKHHNFAVLRIGTEYIFPIKHNWYITPIVTFDHKIDYNSLEFAIGIGKRF
jgi:hypothetical protein